MFIQANRKISQKDWQMLRFCKYVYTVNSPLIFLMEFYLQVKQSFKKRTKVKALRPYFLLKNIQFIYLLKTKSVNDDPKM